MIEGLKAPKIGSTNASGLIREKHHEWDYKGIFLSGQ